jgi:hypothetical protein
MMSSAPDRAPRRQVRRGNALDPSSHRRPLHHYKSNGRGCQSVQIESAGAEVRRGDTLICRRILVPESACRLRYRGRHFTGRSPGRNLRLPRGLRIHSAGQAGIAFDEIWKQSPRPVDVGGFPGLRRQGEAICYRADGMAILATSEGLPCPLIEASRISAP